MTSSGKYKLNTSNLYNRNQAEYTSANNYSTPRRPQRTAATPTTRNPSYEEATDGEDEKKLLSLSERIKRLSTSRVLKDSSQLTHNNNEPFTYLRGPQRKPSGLGGSATGGGVNIGAYSRPTRLGVSSTPIARTNNSATISNGPKGREVIYAQVVVDPEDRKNKQIRNKRTVHRSYNNNDYSTAPSLSNKYTPISARVRTTGIGSSSAFSSHKKSSNLLPPTRTPVSNSYSMKGKNVTTVLINSSSDDLPSSVNMEERIRGGFHNDTRYRSSSSPLLATSNDADYYPKSPGIVKQHLQNGYNGRSRYENHYQRHSTDYLHKQSDDDDYNDYKFGGKYGRERIEQSPPPPLFSSYGGRGDTDNSDEFYNYQPVNYGGKSASTNFIDSYGYNKSSRANYRIDEEDEYDTHKNSNKLFDDRIRSKTLGRDTSFKTSINRTEDFINRSKTLDNRISSLRERSMMLEEQNRRERGGVGGDPYSDFKLTTSHHDSDFTNKKNNAQNAKNLNTKTKDKTSGSGNIFSTLLRRNNKKAEATKTVSQSKSTSIQNTSSNNISSNNRSTTPSKPTDGIEKKPGHSSNFFTSFLEKKRNKKQQQQTQTNTTTDFKKGQTQRGGDEQNTYQSFGNWPSDPPTLSVMDYSNPVPTSKPYYGESNIDTEDTSAHGSDIWKKSYGNDMTKVKRRWTMREPSKPSVIREEEDLTSRTLGRKPGYTSTTAINTSSSIDRRKNRSYSDDREGSYDPMNSKRYNDDRFLKVPGPATNITGGGKYSTIDTRYSPEKISYSPQRYDEYDGYNNNTLTKRGRNISTDKLSKGYSGGGGFSSGSESTNNRLNANGSLRSVYLHEPAVIQEIPRTLANSGGVGGVGGGGASLSGLSGRRTLSKDEISNYSGSRKETKQLSRSMSMAHPWGPRFIHNEIDYSRNNNPHLPPRPPSRSPSGSLGINSSRQTPNTKSSSRSPSKSFIGGTRPKPPLPLSSANKGRKATVSSSSVESLLRQDTPDEVLLNKKKGSNTKLGRSKSMSVPQSRDREPRDGKGNRFSTLWFNKKNSNK